MIDLAAYVLEPLWQEGAYLLSRGSPRGRRAGLVPAVLVVAPVGAHPAPASLRRLEHEYALRAALDPAWAVQPLALAQHQGRSALVLENLEGEPLTRLLGVPMEVGRFLRLALAIARALRGVHAVGLIHKDLKPGHILVAPASGEVRLTGFGLASRLRREPAAPAPPEVLASTLAYMAPEQTGRMNRSIDARSDLYALGVTLYEMLTGMLPFTASEPLEWVHCHISLFRANSRMVYPHEHGSSAACAVSSAGQG
jgi:serine/threonine protein kinase